MKKIVILLSLALILGALIFFIVSNRTSTVTEEVLVYTPGDPLDITLDMANAWRDNVAASSETAISLESFLDTDLFTRAVAADLVARSQDMTREPMIDVLLCQAVIPPRVVGRLIVETPTEAQIMIMARGSEERSPNQTVVTLTGNGEGAWIITGVECTQGEVAPDVEFPFDNEGYLLKSVPPPYQAGDWHVVFEQNGQMGYVAPLTFTSESICISTNGEESVCDPSALTEPLPALVQGDMTEVGVTVRRITFN